jgi:hypothetical protein
LQLIKQVHYTHKNKGQWSWSLLWQCLILLWVLTFQNLLLRSLWFCRVDGIRTFFRKVGSYIQKQVSPQSIKQQLFFIGTELFLSTYKEARATDILQAFKVTVIPFFTSVPFIMCYISNCDVSTCIH